jgi:hypothetical protein
MVVSVVRFKSAVWCIGSGVLGKLGWSVMAHGF